MKTGDHAILQARERNALVTLAMLSFPVCTGVWDSPTELKVGFNTPCSLTAGHAWDLSTASLKGTVVDKFCKCVDFEPF